MTLGRTRLDEAVALGARAPLAGDAGVCASSRAVDARRRRSLPWLDALEVLTASGSSMAWTGALAVVASRRPRLCEPLARGPLRPLHAAPRRALDAPARGRSTTRGGGSR